jgi:outer membrane immunogenic protein
MRRIFAVTLAAVMVGPAMAADYGVAPTPVYAPAYEPAPAYVPGYIWTGFYVGANVGAGFATGSGTTTIFTPGGGIFSLTGTGSQSADGVIGGGQIGYNWQFGYWVVGAEADFAASGQRGGSQGIPCGGLPPQSCSVAAHVNVSSFGTVRGRVGFTVGDNRWLFYGTGGYALMNFSGGIDVTTEFGTTLNVLSASTTKSGYAIGGGVEAALWGYFTGWTGGIEYLYLGTGDWDTGRFVVPPGGVLARAGVPVGSTITDTRSINNNIVRAKINYRF